MKINNHRNQLQRSPKRFPRVMLSLLLASAVSLGAAETNKVAAAKPKAEIPQPTVIDPGGPGVPPSDAIVLFDGKDLSKFRGEKQTEPTWKLHDGVMESTPPGGIFSKEEFADCQVHVEFATPVNVKGDGQGRGNSGVYLMGRFEIQVLDNYNNKTYPNGQCGAMYGNYAPLVNACRKPGEWQTYDIIFTAPKFDEMGKATKRARMTVLQNGVLVQNNAEIYGETFNDKPALYIAHPPKGPIKLQDHNNPTRFRNVWIRPL